MPQRYKLRLGDGTVLAVDSEGLGTWAHDRRAMAQAVGTQQWRPLQDVVAEEAAAARLRGALVPPKPRGQVTPAPPPEPAREPAPPSPASFESPFEPHSPFEPQPSSPFEPQSPSPFESQPQSPFDAQPQPSFEQPFEPGSLLPPTPEPQSPPFELPDFEAPQAGPAPITPSSFTGSDFAAFDAPQAASAPIPQAAPTPFPRVAPTPTPLAGPDDDEPVSSRYFEAAASASPAAEEDLPVIPMKPLDDRQEFRSAWSDDGSTADDEYEEEEKRAGGFDGETLSVLERVGGFLSRVLAPLAPAADKLTARRQTATEEEPEAFASEPEEEEIEDDLEPAGPTLAERASGWLQGLRARFRRAKREDDDAVADRSEESYDFDTGRMSAPARPAAPPRPLVPEKAAVVPKPVSELPVVPFKPTPRETRETRETDYVYGDDEPSRIWSGFLEPAWQWLKRIVTTGALVGALWYAWTERSQWLPRAADLGQSMFGEIDRQVLSRTRHEQRQKALSDVGDRLPQLAPETIQLVFARNPTGVEEAGEVFQITREAAERGATTLPPADAEELRAIQGELMAGLSRTEQERVREYDRTRARRVVFPFENPHVMDLVARGARALPAERRGRLQALMHQAVVAGLAIPEAAPAEPQSR